MILVGDCREKLLELDEASVDAIVTDPPYGLSFMGSAWDHACPGPDYWREVLRVAKPGAIMLAFGGTRTFHRLFCAVEDAGWEIRDTIMWVFGSGMPKGKNLRGEFEGRGTGLKPAWEPILVARKPCDGPMKANVELHGTGAYNIDACRIDVVDRGNYASNCSGDRGHAGTRTTDRKGSTDIRTGGGSAGKGRWPANLIHDGSEEVIELFPAEAGAFAPVHRRRADKFRNSYGTFAGNVDEQASTFRGDSGSAARFFYCAKATRQDRNDGCDAIDEQPLHWSSGDQSPGTFQSSGTKKAARNNHPTVKPTPLMRYLVRLVTPPGGMVLDPFMGSGSTGRGAILEGRQFVGIELEQRWADIAHARIRACQPGLALGGAA